MYFEDAMRERVLIDFLFFFFTISEYRLIYRRKFEGRILSMIHGTCMEKQQFEEKEIGERVRVPALNGCSSKE